MRSIRTSAPTWRHPDGTPAGRAGAGRFISEREPVEGATIATDYSRFGFYAKRDEQADERTSTELWLWLCAAIVSSFVAAFVSWVGQW